MATYDSTKMQLEAYFDRTAAKTWEQLTSDAPVSRVRQTVRAGRDEMRETLLSMIPPDLTGQHVLDAGCGTGAMSAELAKRGARVTAVDISPNLLDVARRRLDGSLRDQVTFLAGDMMAPELGWFDHVIAMDSLIHYSASDIGGALSQLSERVRGSIVFTIAPRTPALMAMWGVGKMFPRSDRSPAIQPVAPNQLERHIGSRNLQTGPRISRGFYISQAMRLTQ